MIKILLIACFILFHVYIISQLYYWLRGITQGAWLMPVLVLYGAAGTLLPVLGTVWPENGSVKNTLQAVGNIYLGIVVYLALALTVMFLVRVLAGAVHHGFGPVPDSKASAAVLLICALFTFSMNLFGYINAGNPKVIEYQVSTGSRSGQDSSDSGEDRSSVRRGSMKIVLLSDLHLGVNTSVKHMEEAVKRINAQKADVILIAGDFFNSTFYGVPHPDRLAEVLGGMKSKYGVYYCWGNHDIEEPLFCGFTLQPLSKAYRSPQMDEFIDKCGFRDLNDRVVTLDGVQFAGRLDAARNGDGKNERMTPAELLGQTDPDKPVVVLEHEPVEFQELKEAGADLVLSGHTHGGQIWPGNLIVRLMYGNASGEKYVDGLYTVTTAGLGYYGPPIRTGCNSEISVINFSWPEDTGTQVSE